MRIRIISILLYVVHSASAKRRVYAAREAAIWWAGIDGNRKNTVSLFEVLSELVRVATFLTATVTMRRGVRDRVPFASTFVYFGAGNGRVTLYV